MSSVLIYLFDSYLCSVVYKHEVLPSSNNKLTNTKVTSSSTKAVHQFSRGVKFHDTTVAVSVSHEEVAVLRNGHVSRFAEVMCVVAWDEFLS